MAAVSRTRDEVERLWWLTGVLLLGVMVAVDLAARAPDQRRVRRRRRPHRRSTPTCDVRASVAGLTLAASVASGVWHDNLGERDWAIRFATCVLICGLAVLAAHANERRRLRLERTTALAQRVLDALAVELTGARTVKEVADGFVGPRGRHAGRHVGDGAHRSTPTTCCGPSPGTGGAGTARTSTRRSRSASDLPGAVAAREGTDVHYRSVKEIVAAFPDLAGYYPTDRSLHLLPLHRDGRTYGLLALTFPPDLVHGRRGRLPPLARGRPDQCRACGPPSCRTRTPPPSARSLLAEASMTLSRSLDMDTTVAEVGRLLVPRFADWCSLQLLRDGQLETRGRAAPRPRHHRVGALR